MTRFTPHIKSLLGATAIATLGLTVGAVNASAAPSDTLSFDKLERIERAAETVVQTAQLSDAMRRASEYKVPTSSRSNRNSDSNSSSSNSSRSSRDSSSSNSNSSRSNSNNTRTTTNSSRNNNNTGSSSNSSRSNNNNTRTTTNSSRNNNNTSNSSFANSLASALRNTRTATVRTNNSYRNYGSSNRNSSRHSTTNFRFGSSYQPTRIVSQSFGRYTPSNWNSSYRGYSTNYRSRFGISFTFGTPGYSQYRWAPSQYGFYRSSYGSYYGYQNQTQCDRIYVDGLYHGRLTPISVVECYNPWDGHYIIEGTERVEYSYHY